jgi:lyso-ornithine lipid O-acyltransferase
MIRLFRSVRFIAVMVAYTADMVWRGRKLSHHDRMKLVAQRQRAGCVALTKGLNVTSEVIGAIPGDRATLLVCNHIGTLDPWILASNFNLAFVAKSEMEGWPLLGWVCRSVGIIFAHRKNVMKTAQTVDEIRARMRSGVAVMIFPEGTTSDGTALLPFKTGGFEAIANMSDGFVVPVYFHVRSIKRELVDLHSRKQITWYAPQKMLANLWQVLGLGPLHFVIRIGEPIATNDKNRKELAKESQGAVEALKRSEEKLILAAH